MKKKEERGREEKSTGKCRQDPAKEGERIKRRRGGKFVEGYMSHHNDASIS